MVATSDWKSKVDLFRKKFAGREDMYSTFTTWTRNVRDEHGNFSVEEGSGIMPACSNYGDKNVCLIAQRKGKCSECSHQRYAPISDTAVWKHISGEYLIIIHMLTDKGIKFGALDFDHALNKVSSDVEDPEVRAQLQAQYEEENAESAFADALLVKQYSEKMGIPCYIARSRKKGYHVYWFFSEWIDGKYFTSFARHIAQEVGLNQRALEMGIPAPEMFPKQTVFKQDKVGNGIRVPMHEPNMQRGRSCWVNDDRTPVVNQWEYFATTKEVSLADLERVIAEHNIEVIEGNAVRTNSRPRVPGQARVGDAQTQLDQTGDFWNVVNNCPAMKPFWEKDEYGAYKWEKDHDGRGVPHGARLASLSFALHTKNGLDILRERWPSEKTEAQIEFAISAGQRPFSCAAMQEHAVCAVGVHPKHVDHCLKRIPPKGVENGVLVENPDNLPEDQWPAPSPIRFKSERHLSLQEILDKLKELVAINPRPTDFGQRLFSLVKSAQYLPIVDKQEVETWIKAQKVMKARELSQMSKRARQDVQDERFKEKTASLVSFVFQDCTYFQKDGGYYRSFVDNKGNRIEQEITDWTCEITDELEEIYATNNEDKGAEREIRRRFYIGKLKTRHYGSYTFKCNAEDWLKGPDRFFQHLTLVAGTAINYKRSDFDDIRTCINNMSRQNANFRVRKKLHDFGHYVFNGKYHYITPSLIVTADGVRKNDEYEMEFDHPATKGLDMLAIEDSEWRSLATHIVNDYFECNKDIACMGAFAHAMASAVSTHIPLNKSPVFWLHGNYSGGKSFIIQAAQCFFGDFKDLASATSTGKSKLALASYFRDAFCAIDDFKEALVVDSARAILEFVQNTYDRSMRLALTRTGGLREESHAARGLVGFTSEDLPDREASALTRMILVELEGTRNQNKDAGERVKRNISRYAGFTPAIIQHVYAMGKEEVSKIYLAYRSTFETHLKGMFEKEGVLRIAENLAFNMTGLRLALDLMLERSVITQQRHNELLSKHENNLKSCGERVMAYVVNSKGSSQFLRQVSALMQDKAHYVIRGWPGYVGDAAPNARVIGFYMEKEYPGVIALSASAYTHIVGELKKENSRLQSKNHIGRQLADEEHIPNGMWDMSSPARMKRIQVDEVGRAYCWMIKLESLGLPDPRKPAKVVSINQQTTVEKPKQSKSEDEGDTLWSNN